MTSDEFVESALSGAPAAWKTLLAQPEIARSTFHAALVAGDAETVQKFLEASPHLATAKGGPRDWEPLLYVCFSRFSTAGLTVNARLLLRHDANPDATCIFPEFPDSPLSCLYGAAGLTNNSSLARVLLESGANPNDNESVYHSTEHADLECLRLLLAHNASLANTNALKHMLDREDLEGVRLLLDAGANPNETNAARYTALHWAVWRTRGPEIIRLLVERGADLNARRADGRTAYAIAVQSGQTATAKLLEELGSPLEIPAIDRFIAQCENAAPEELKHLASEVPVDDSPHFNKLLPDLASTHRTSALRVLLDAGLPIDARGDHGGTALHWACWKGYSDVVELLLERGASLTIRDTQFNAVPAGWFEHGLHNCWDDRGDYAATARVLLPALGPDFPIEPLCGLDPGVDAVLRERGLIE